MNPGYSSTSVGGGEMDLISWEFIECSLQSMKPLCNGIWSVEIFF